jgi:DNA (cytosine-5)-methyltransferase 1
MSIIIRTERGTMKSIELFAGIGGIALAAEWAGVETVAFCERETYCQKVLNKHWSDVPIFDDVRTLNRQMLEEKGAIEPNERIGLLSGGYPCQGESVIGERKGATDERWLWPEMFRLVKELRPHWVVGENVAGHITMGLDEVLSNLEEENYKARTFVLPAVSVGAHHERYRVFVVAHSNDEPKLQANTTAMSSRSERKSRENIAGWDRREVPRTYWETYQSPVCGMDDGISKRLDKDRLITLGNAVVPQQIYPIFKYIMEIERMNNQ